MFYQYEDQFSNHHKVDKPSAVIDRHAFQANDSYSLQPRCNWSNHRAMAFKDRRTQGRKADWR